jgi:hypothetical protein
VTNAPVSRQALVVDDVAYRNDGEGWHPTDQLPGIGLDPATIAALPAMLERATEATDRAVDVPRPPLASDPPTDRLTIATTRLDAPEVAAKLSGLDGTDSSRARALDATTKAVDVPGIIAVDLVEQTELQGPATLSFDDRGRLIGLRIIARNTNLEANDLVVDTVITFRYPDQAPELPKPEPVYVEPTPATDGEG